MESRTGCMTRRRFDRRKFLAQALGAVLFSLSGEAASEATATKASRALPSNAVRKSAGKARVRLFLGGDVMTGRGIDQIMRQPSDPLLYERAAKSAKEYIALAEKASGPIPRNVDPAYVWGDALAELDRARPDARIINLETAVTTANDRWFGKRIHYRMHPANVACLTAARIDCCVLANNHVLDWGYDGLRETIASLRGAGVRTAGAGGNLAEARAPATIVLRTGGRVLVFSYGSPSSGIPVGWAAKSRRPGISELDESNPESAEQVARSVHEFRRPGDLVVVSVHWGVNWGYEVPSEQQRLAHSLIDQAGVDVVYGHSSHHPRPIEVYRDKLILYGCGDLLNDYEGIGGHDSYRPELGLMYLPEIDQMSGQLRGLTLVPTRIRAFRITGASGDEGEWVREVLEREGRAFGTRINRTRAGDLELAIT